MIESVMIDLLSDGTGWALVFDGLFPAYLALGYRTGFGSHDVGTL